MPKSFPILQFPNRPLIVTVIAAAIARGTRGRTAAAATLVSRLALLAWSAEEIFKGANWFRRLIGIGGATYAVAELARARRVTPPPRVPQ
ncbi:MAG TPA: hypothetical protein VJU80_09670 [Solirubrobacteraceae bacterium]|nr:hypothetical protein [Solirubrobacteraceae bacterium]